MSTPAKQPKRLIFLKIFLAIKKGNLQGDLYTSFA